MTTHARSYPRVKVLCTDEGRHPERELARIDIPPEPGRPVRSDVAKWLQAAAVSETVRHAGRDFATKDPGHMAATDVAQTMPDGTERLRKLHADCRSCRRTLELNVDTLTQLLEHLMGRDDAITRHTYRLDISTGATV